MNLESTKVTVEKSDEYIFNELRKYVSEYLFTSLDIFYFSSF